MRCLKDKSSHAHSFTGEDVRELDIRRPTLRSLGEGRALDFRGRAMMFANSTEALEITGSDLVFAVVDAPDVVDATGPFHYPLNKEAAYEFAYFRGDFQAAIDTTAPGVWEWSQHGEQAASPGLQLNSFVYDGTNYAFHRNGEELVTMAATGGQTGDIQGAGYYRDPISGREISPSPVVLGGRPRGLTVLYEADQAELVLLDAAVTDDQLDALHRYLMERWDL